LSERISVVCLGSGAALTQGRQWNSLLIDGHILLDLPPTAIPQMHRLGVDPRAIDVVFITHHHGDHNLGLPFLYLEYAVRYEREEPLYVVGPDPVEEIANKAFDLAWPKLREQGIGPRVPIKYVSIEEEGDYSAGDLQFTAIPMEHFGLHALGYRFTYRGRTFAYTGDTGDCEQICRLLDGVDVAIIELTHGTAKEDPGHLDIHEVLRITKGLRARGATVLATHMFDSPAPHKGITICEDGHTFYV